MKDLRVIAGFLGALLLTVAPPSVEGLTQFPDLLERISPNLD